MIFVSNQNGEHNEIYDFLDNIISISNTHSHSGIKWANVIMLRAHQSSIQYEIDKQKIGKSKVKRPKEGETTKHFFNQISLLTVFSLFILASFTRPMFCWLPQMSSSRRKGHRLFLTNYLFISSLKITTGKKKNS